MHQSALGSNTVTTIGRVSLFSFTGTDSVSGVRVWRHGSPSGIREWHR